MKEKEIFRQSEWIWLANSKVNQYADFVVAFAAKQGKEIVLRISADTNYAVYLNGKYVYSGQYPDYPHYKVYDELHLEAFCHAGKNRMAILCYYAGEDSSTYCKAEAGLIFEVVSGGEILAKSGKATLSREDRGYRSGAVEKVTPQLGHTYYYDATRDDGWKEKDACGFSESAVVAKSCVFYVRPVRRLQIKEDAAGKMCLQGEYKNGGEANTAAEHMDKAFLRFDHAEEKMPLPCGKELRSGTGADGVCFIADMGEETAGFALLDLEVPHDADVWVGFGEHLHDMRVRTRIGDRNFAFGYRAKKGKNRFCGVLRRLGCRYLQVHIDAPQAKVYDCRILPADYPAEEMPLRIGDGLRRKIDENGVRTLKRCMHEHYEDCPWREQALYAMDSRNQMLFGSYVFKDNEGYVKANLRLMSKGLREDGLLELCFPARVGITIPSFSCYFVLALAEYFERTGDLAFMQETYPVAEKILDTFAARADGTGLIAAFQGREYWNFYEWRSGLDGQDVGGETSERYDSCLNLLYLIALQRFATVLRVLDESRARRAEKQIGAMKAAVVSNFYDDEAELFCTSLQNGRKGGAAMLPQALAVAADCCPEKEGMLCQKLKSGEGLIPITLSNRIWLYDALLKGSEKELEFVLRDLESVYGKMVTCGDTTLYETEDGAEDFGGAGSLCHGWSAVGCYIYRKYEEKIRDLK